MFTTPASRPVGALVSAAAATALTVSFTAAPAPRVPELAAPRISTHAVELMANPFEQPWLGATAVPLPALNSSAELQAAVAALQAAAPSATAPADQLITGYLSDVVNVVPALVAGGFLLGAVGGATVGGSLLGFAGEQAASTGAILFGYAGMVVGAALGVVAIPFAWAKLTFDLVVALLNPPAAPEPVLLASEPQTMLRSTEPVPEPEQAALATAGQNDPTAGAALVEPTDIAAERGTTPQTPANEPGADEEMAPGGISPELSEVSAPMEPMEPVAAAPETEPTETAPARARSLPKLRDWAKHLTSPARETSEDAETGASAKAESEKDPAGASERSQRSESEHSGGTETKRGGATEDGAEKKAESAPAE